VPKRIISKFVKDQSNNNNNHYKIYEAMFDLFKSKSLKQQSVSKKQPVSSTTKNKHVTLSNTLEIGTYTTHNQSQSTNKNDKTVTYKSEQKETPIESPNQCTNFGRHHSIHFAATNNKTEELKIKRSCSKNAKYKRLAIGLSNRIVKWKKIIYQNDEKGEIQATVVKTVGIEHLNKMFTLKGYSFQKMAPGNGIMEALRLDCLLDIV